MNPDKQNRLRQIPGVGRVLELLKTDPDLIEAPKSFLVGATRQVIEALRTGILENPLAPSESVLDETAVTMAAKSQVHKAMSLNLKRVVKLMADR